MRNHYWSSHRPASEKAARCHITNTPESWLKIWHPGSLPPKLLESNHNNVENEWLRTEKKSCWGLITQMETLHPLTLSTNEDKDATCGTLCYLSCVLHKSCVSHWAPINSDRSVQSGRSRPSWGSSMDRQAETRICQVFGRISGNTATMLHGSGVQIYALAFAADLQRWLNIWKWHSPIFVLSLTIPTPLTFEVADRGESRWRKVKKDTIICKSTPCYPTHPSADWKGGKGGGHI